ncbi:uncharacterized protein LOC133806056 [Humulus lupulus]|uniref:uncharacterized protein LOC133806056 n=1 Tax=Humulus lupulus TaxID=3486 RepID=UPI002B406978|nr:uncharacterized protein LOC133806056 [Humulus lupulus]
MESANVVVDDLKNFSKYSHEEEIDRFIDAQHQTGTIGSMEGHYVATTFEKVGTEMESIAATSGQIEKDTPIIITNSVQREPSTRVKKNHPSELILGNLEESMVTRRRNKARLVAQGYTQIEGIDFDETLSPVVRLESIRLLLAISCIIGFKLYQMDVKPTFLNKILNEEAYVEQPKGFEDPHLPNHVFKLQKALYGLKQAPQI